ncbi:MAG: T9SS type A sorting domain-containing protein [Melioribacteraceae bacterium]|nr:T9SS type A sorting domain-containing protein [Melioribacteraceae bacterium]MCF8393377.1 T9SS type A sorting domain-containing protein [Melioribacteraceae bacterium]MCF8418942.1 T9SS type A sorting domain-containing protein [Melioribacteraceae bacterium]
MGYGNSVIQTNDGGYVFTGFRGPNLANLELFLTKTDGNGFEQWTAIVEDAAGMCLTQTENGDFIVGGLTYSQAGDIDIFLARFEADPTGLNDDVSPVPVNYRLNQNYPNPFNPSTKISYSIPEPGLVTLEIFDVLGREIQTLVNEFQKPDNYELDFTAGELSSGVYFYTLRAGEFSKTKKMILLR